ncbi:YiiX family permuted papain-like enzyme [Verrucomicrobiaceae bacterium N1E253]|uniref:YiiX family permuted papain-like enzyme n=1 Tax=Oceaniferula marina TaxID=2748318 RepID=A0A851G9K2_9BACT|nr:YiiX family permuted papain-like enzyme [Oceaniferula marina]NWK54283.1 YiiX family permuted papain-like enzyme [Oceaniferula marina]
MSHSLPPHSGIRTLLTGLSLQLLIILTAFCGEKNGRPYLLQDGDIVFQSSNDVQSKAVKAATRSQWSHVGLVFFHNGKPWVLEAVQPVKTTPLADFIARSPKSFHAMRLKDAAQHINRKSSQKARQYAQRQLGKNYDPYFKWSEDQMYCSELVWKIYKYATGIELCKTRPMSSYNFHHPDVQPIIKQRYGSISQLPLNEAMVAPSDLAESPLLMEVPRLNAKISKN